jgi:hypothetical protein
MNANAKPSSIKARLVLLCLTLLMLLSSTGCAAGMAWAG